MPQGKRFVSDPSLSRPSSGEFGPKIGLAEGYCPRCGRIRRKPYPASEVLCDCWEYCPQNHGQGPFQVRMNDFNPEAANMNVGEPPGSKPEKHWDPMAYRAIELGVPGGAFYGDTEHPLDILKVCPVCQFHSSQKPILVKLE